MIGTIIAMESEAEILLTQMQVTKQETVGNKKVYLGVAFDKEIALVICGIGKVNAAIGTQIAIDKYNASTIVNFGVAGGLNQQVELCSVYEIENAVQFDFDLTQLNGTKMGTLDEYSENYLPLSPANLFPRKNLGTADRFNDSTDDYLLLTATLNADIRDMEGGAIVQTAIANRLPVYAFKAISDLAGSGSTTDQYLKNRSSALANLKEKLGQIFSVL